jgi:hypothetical protein
MSNTEGGSGLRLFVITSESVKYGYNDVVITSSGSGTVAGIKIYLNGLLCSVGSSVDLLGANTIINANNIFRLSYNNSLAPDPFIGRIRILQIINRVATVYEIRQVFLKGTISGVVSSDDFLLDIDFNQTGTNNSSISNGTYVQGAILSVADNGSGKARFTLNGTTEKSPVNGATVSIIGTTDYNTAGAVSTRISDTQFDVTTINYVSSQTGTYSVNVTATGGAAYTDFMTP